LLSQQRFRSDIEEIKALANSNDLAIQAMRNQAVTDRLAHKEQMQHHEKRIQILKNIAASLANLSARRGFAHHSADAQRDR
jgi:hypothetical protein